jgi:hypothetical protein
VGKPPRVTPATATDAAAVEAAVAARLRQRQQPSHGAATRTRSRTGSTLPSAATAITSVTTRMTMPNTVGLTTGPPLHTEQTPPSATYPGSHSCAGRRTERTSARTKHQHKHTNAHHDGLPSRRVAYSTARTQQHRFQQPGRGVWRVQPPRLPRPMTQNTTCTPTARQSTALQRAKTGGGCTAKGAQRREDSEVWLPTSHRGPPWRGRQ